MEQKYYFIDIYLSRATELRRMINEGFFVFGHLSGLTRCSRRERSFSSYHQFLLFVFLAHTKETRNSLWEYVTIDGEEGWKNSRNMLVYALLKISLFTIRRFYLNSNCLKKKIIVFWNISDHISLEILCGLLKFPEILYALEKCSWNVFANLKY